METIALDPAMWRVRKAEQQLGASLMSFLGERGIREGQMSLFSLLNTAVSGMSAQSNLLGTIGDNIANSNTVGYKQASAQFETALGLSTGTTYNSGGVQSTIRYNISDPGTTLGTTSPTDLAINGNGFFVVQDSTGAQYLTRAGNFVPDSAGDLVNAAGFSLLGYTINSNTAAAGTTLQVVNMASSTLAATATTAGTLSVNLPSTATAVASNDPSTDNSTNTAYTSKASVVTYDDLGKAVTVDLYMTKTGDNAGPPPTSTWTVAGYNAADQSSGGGFPYASSSGTDPAGGLGSGTFTFDSTTGSLDSASPSTLSLAIPNGNTISLNLSNTTQLATPFTQVSVTANGNSPSKVSSVTVGPDGTMTAVYSSGAKVPTYKIPVATVPSEDNLTPLSGNVYTTNATSGSYTIGTANSSGYGAIQSDTLEQSTVDIATQLTDMIASQRAYEFNSKVLQTSSDLLSLISKIQT